MNEAKEKRPYMKPEMEIIDFNKPTDDEEKT